MKDIINAQLKKNRDLNLLFKKLETEINIDENFKQTLIKVKKENINNIDELVEYTVKKTLESIYEINQYLIISKVDINDLKNIYFKTWNKLEETNSDKILIEHHKNLSEWISKFYPKKFINTLKENRKIGKVLNKEYKADIQKQVLDLNCEELLEPIIDIGCGKNGILVKELSKKYKNVIGIDRLITDQSQYLIEIDWFDFVFENQKWGAVISNMSFTNHMIYTLHNDKKNIFKYILKYKEILDSLKMNGKFIYAPSLSFLEEKLDKQKYEIVSKKVINNYSMTKIIKKNI